MIKYLYKYYREINKWHKLPTETIKDLQLKKFAEIFNYARKHSKFYQTIYKEAGIEHLEIKSYDDIKKIPIIDKKLLRQYKIDDIATCDIQNPKRFNIRSTSGSTGEPFKIAYSKREDFTNQTRQYWSLLQYGYKPWKKVLIVTRYDEDAMYQYEKDIRLLRTIQHVLPLFRRRIVSVYEPIEIIIEKIKKTKPYILWSTPSMLQIIALKMKEKSERVNVPYVCFTSETVFEKQADLFKEILGTHLVNYFGCMESPMIGFDMDMEHKFKLYPNSNMFEFIDIREENDIKLGTPIITNLYNYSMPIIRYNTNDIAYIDDSPDFGIKYLGKIIGRLDDILTFADGTKFAHHHAHEMFMDFHECEHFKFVQYPDNSIALQLKILKTADPENIELLARDRWNKRFPNQELKIEFLDEFPIDTSSGKTRNMEIIRE
jgi:phenylacetate-coenzyme A ligase PaaK-like adenylate-forming protein